MAIAIDYHIEMSKAAHCYIMRSVQTLPDGKQWDYSPYFKHGMRLRKKLVTKLLSVLN